MDTLKNIMVGKITIMAFCCKCGIHLGKNIMTPGQEPLTSWCGVCSSLDDDARLARGGTVDQHGLVCSDDE
jgi:hypothetical protein